SVANDRDAGAAHPIQDYSQSVESIVPLFERLGQQPGVNHTVPIFQLREQLQPPLTSDQVDTYLWQLQRLDRAELLPLQAVEPYSDCQLARGLFSSTASRRWSEWPWFFVRLV
ncbi:MAG: hypothetical protein AAFZ80_11395, partial [Cyanobacteria bacterium P01_A01_bin.105]